MQVYKPHISYPALDTEWARFAVVRILRRAKINVVSTHFVEIEAPFVTIAIGIWILAQGTAKETQRHQKSLFGGPFWEPFG